MPNRNIWKYCSVEHCKELLISFQLFGDTEWNPQKQIASLYALSNHISDHYLQTSIPKRDGSLRQLLVPDTLLKTVQRNILHHILSQIPISPYATAYKTGTNIVSNASPHVGKKQILKLDIENFFGSITFYMIYKFAFPHDYFPPSIRALLTHLCCYEDYLPQGAPTSATISNLVMKHFDDYIGQWALINGITYTRYSDDMVFSGQFDFHTVKNKVQNFLCKMGFTINQKKTKRLTQHNQQIITGLVVNTKTQVPLQYRKELRKEIYYSLKYGIASHLTKTNDENYLPLGKSGIIKYLSMLLGKINFILQANPNDHYFKHAHLLIKKMLLNETTAI